MGNWRIQDSIAYVPEVPSLYAELTVRQTLSFCRLAFGGWDRGLAEEWQRKFALDGDKKVSHLSKGMRTKLALLVGISHRAELLLLDEPASGLDPGSRVEIRQHLKQLAKSLGACVLLSSHSFDDLEDMAERILVIHNGTIRFEDSMEAIGNLTVYELPQPWARPVPCQAIRILVAVVHLMSRGKPGSEFAQRMYMALLFVTVMTLSESLVAAERTRQTLIWLRTLPISDAKIVSSKFITFSLIFWFGVLSSSLLLQPAWFSHPAKMLPLGALIHTYGGIVLGGRLLLGAKAGLVVPAGIIAATGALGQLLSLDRWLMTPDDHAAVLISISLVVYVAGLFVTATLLSRKDSCEWALGQ